tara:strand:- start:241 stop:549 length:309 start_codon:yes stop_codon:yes gene_type:complete
MFTIARNSLKTHYTRNHKVHDDIEILAYKAVEEENHVSENNAHLQYALSRLDPYDRELVILNRYQEIKYDDLAEIMGSTPGAVKTRVCRILKKLKNIYLESI